MLISKKTKGLLARAGAASFLGVLMLTLALAFTISFIPNKAEAYTPSCTGVSCKFVFLAPLPINGITPTNAKEKTGGDIDLGGDGATQYVKNLYIFGVAVAAGLAVIMIVIGGIEMSTIDAMSGKIDGSGKKRINAALSGLALALLSYLILSTINVNLLSANFVPKVIDADPNIGFSVNPVVRVVAGAPGSGGNGGGGGAGAVIASTPAGATVDTSRGFANKTWNDYALQQVQASGLMNLNPVDAAKYFPDGNITAQGWVNIISGITKEESNYNPNNVFYENTMGKNSVGLLQLSYDDGVVKNLGYSEQDLKDPIKNLQAGIQIFADQVRKDNVISGTNSNGKWVGGSAYWSTLRK